MMFTYHGMAANHEMSGPTIVVSPLTVPASGARLRKAPATSTIAFAHLNSLNQYSDCIIDLIVNLS